MSSNDNLRRPPAYQTYPSDESAKEEVKLMSLAELGLRTRMEWACWSNDTVPADHALLARVLGLPEADVRANLTEAVLRFFAPAKGYSERLECPELVAQMSRMMARREAQSEGASITNAKRYGQRVAKRAARRIAPEKSRAQQSKAKSFIAEEGKEHTSIGHSAAFTKFWAAWPKSERKEAQGRCWEVWDECAFDEIQETILAHVEALLSSERWRGGFIPAPLVYLNQRRWEGAETTPAVTVDL